MFLLFESLEDELEQSSEKQTTEKPSSNEQAKPDLEADNKQLRELVTSLHQKQQTTSLEVLVTGKHCDVYKFIYFRIVTINPHLQGVASLW